MQPVVNSWLGMLAEEVPTVGQRSTTVVSKDAISDWSARRWLNLVDELDFEIRHRPGSTHLNADAMFRRPSVVNAVRKKFVQPAETLTLPRDWSCDVSAPEQRDDGDLAWVIQTKPESPAMLIAGDVQGRTDVVKTLIAQNGLSSRWQWTADSTLMDREQIDLR